jgi:DNA mismatch endonuclease, patch repair protein
MMARLAPFPSASSEAASMRMKAVRRRDTPLELAVRSILHCHGLRYRVHVRPIGVFRRVADIVFRSEKVAVFVDGCFWHGCPSHGTLPVSNGEWWKSKIELNRVRDAETTLVLESAGWAVVRVWEHQAPGEAAASIEDLVRSRKR